MAKTPVEYNKYGQYNPSHTGSRQKGTPCRKYWNGTFLLSKSPQLDVQKSTIMVSEVLDEVARSQPSRDH